MDDPEFDRIRKTNILLAFNYISKNIPRGNNFYSLQRWLESWDVHRYHYSIIQHNEIFSLTDLNPVISKESLMWYWNALDILNPYPKEDVLIIIEMLRKFLQCQPLNTILMTSSIVNQPFQNPDQLFSKDLLTVTMLNQDTKERLTTELDNSHTVQMKSLQVVKESSSLTDSNQIIEQKPQKNQTLHSRLAMLSVMVSKKSLKENQNKK